MEKKNTRQIVVIIAILVISLIGISYAIFRRTLSGEKGKIVVHGGSFDVLLDDGSTPTISLVKAIPTKDADGIKSEQVYRFTVRNNSDIDLNYQIYLDNDTEAIAQCEAPCNLLDDKDVKYEIKKGEESSINTIENRELRSDSIPKNQSQTYELRIWLSYDAGNTAMGKKFFGKIRVELTQYVKAIDKLLTYYVNSDSTTYDIDYNRNNKDAKENKMYVVSHDKGAQQSDWSSEELKSYRYIGADPNNYVTFNNETAGWRIIGIETVDDGTGKREKRIKLIRKDALPVGTETSMSFDNKETESSDWRDARLMMLLNPNYESEKTGVSGSIYWNRTSGNCPRGRAGVTAACNFSEIGLLPETRKMIGDAKWFLGGTSNWDSISTGLVKHFYSYERGTTVVSNRVAYWVGKVGLMYPSDYGYATSGGSIVGRDQCLNSSDVSHWINSDYVDCINNDWLLDRRNHQWTMMSSATDANAAFMVARGGVANAASGNVSYLFSAVRPVVYLNSDVICTSGDGSKSNPFVFR